MTFPGGLPRPVQAALPRIVEATLVIRMADGSEARMRWHPDSGDTLNVLVDLDDQDRLLCELPVQSLRAMAPSSRHGRRDARTRVTVEGAIVTELDALVRPSMPRR